MVRPWPTPSISVAAAALPWITCCCVAFCSGRVAGAWPLSKREPYLLEMEYKYRHPWEIVVKYVDETKRKGPPEERVRLIVDKNEFFYHIDVPWWARCVLPDQIIWKDEIFQDYKKRVRTEVGTNMSLRSQSVLTEISEWTSVDDNRCTLYRKRLSLDLPWIPEFVGMRLVRWYKDKSSEVRQLEDDLIAQHAHGYVNDASS